MTKPIFLVSLPRSGSTLLQRMLSTNDEISTAAEPWILLPLWSMRDRNACRSVYCHMTATNAVNDFIRNLPAGDDTFARAVGTFGATMYEAAAGGKRFFLDKTPRYHLMIPLLEKAFPDARIILLMRNPLAILASICTTFNRGRFWWPDYWIDWDIGHAELVAAKLKGGNHITVVAYEQLVTEPQRVLTQLCEWLGVAFNDRMLTSYRERPLEGRMGDPTGIHVYAGVSTASLDAWRSFFHTSFRRRIARRMLDRIGDDNLQVLGYPREELESALSREPPTGILDLSGRIEYAIGRIAGILDYRYLQARLRSRRQESHFTIGYYRP